MKLRNKKTREVKDWDFGNWYQMILNPDNKESYECTLTDFMDRVAKFREEWEDASDEERKDNFYWYINGFGRTHFSSEILDEIEGRPNNWMARKLFGNYFETKEEAEKAVEKLKAWKRLKDKGFKITFVQDGGYVYLQADWGLLSGDFSDVELLFGGEEEDE